MNFNFRHTIFLPNFIYFSSQNSGDDDGYESSQPEFIPHFAMSDIEEEFVNQMKTIPLQEYNLLLNMIPEKQKLENTIHEMANKIKSKNEQLKELQQVLKREQNESIRISHLSLVRTYF